MEINFKSLKDKEVNSQVRFKQYEQTYNHRVVNAILTIIGDREETAKAINVGYRALCSYAQGDRRITIGVLIKLLILASKAGHDFKISDVRPQFNVNTISLGEDALALVSELNLLDKVNIWLS